MAKNAFTAFVLLFTLQAIAAPGLCAVQDRLPISTEGSSRIEAADLSHSLAPVAAPGLGADEAPQPRHEESDPDRCEAPGLRTADGKLPVSSQIPVGIDMAPAWHQAALHWPTVELSAPDRWARMTTPPAQRSTLDIAPRMRI